jgi:hypothetical protein
MREKFFKDTERDDEFNDKGYLIEGSISNETIQELINVFNQLDIPDSYGFGFNVGLNTNEKDKRMLMQEQITAILEPEITSILNNKYVFTATFMNKLPENKHLLPAHQDWTFTNETKHDSVMCWIPLTDVTMSNGCMCFVPYSNQLFNYIRPFPFPYEKNPVHIYEKNLLGFMKPEPMSAGKMVFINHKTAHASYPNSTNTNRLAVGLSIAPKDEPLHVYCLNPINNGKSMFKYAVDHYFLVNHYHPELSKKYYSGVDYEIAYPCIGEYDYVLPEMSWDDIYTYFSNKGLKYKNRMLEQTQETVIKGKKSWFNGLTSFLRNKYW